MKILGIESSCDETAASVVEDGRKILSSEIASQVEEHALYGGVVPEIASRRHVESIVPLTERALKNAGVTLAEIDAIAVTNAPGLIGALLVGVNFAKGLAYTAGKPLIPVHHIRGHVAACYLAHPDLKPPFLALIASGGHSHIVAVDDYTDYRILGRTRDDAAGEAFDKAARVLGMPYPGGVQMDRAAETGNPKAFALPRPHIDGAPYDVSFSGLKTAVINLAHNAAQKGQTLPANDLAASFCHTVADILATRLMAAAADFDYHTIVAAGGVSANRVLRARLERDCRARSLQLYLPPLSLCGDNAAMIASQGYYEYQSGIRADLSLNAMATATIESSTLL